MKGIKKIIVFSLLMFIPNIVKADCEYKDKVRLQSLASNISFTYDYKEIGIGNNSRVTFDVTITNLHPELYIHDINSDKRYYYNPSGEIKISNYADGSILEFEIYANSSSCPNEYLMPNYITLPPYNRFYTDPICDGVSNLNLCNKWYRLPLSYDQFVKQVTDYKNRKEPELPEPIVDPNDVLIEKIINFLSKYSFHLFGSIIVVCGGLIFYLNRKDDFDLSS